MQKEIKRTWFFNQSPQEVWEFLTKPELLGEWMMETDFQPIVGYKFRFICDEITFCEVLEVKPHTKLSYSWRANSAIGEHSFNSKVVWTLFGKENGTELQLVHNGFTALEDYVGHDKGWTTLSTRLVDLLNTIKNDSSNI
jgi:uncharacterized protein YndB with AHSA1/START domain